MSYINMDHADWVERNIAASKKTPPNAKERRMASDRRGWHAAPDILNPFQRRAFDILGIVGGGIYNAPICWDGLYWSQRSVIMSWCNGFGTFDFNGLTLFVLLCHEARIRGHISPKSHRCLEVSLHERAATGSMDARHPSLPEMIAGWMKQFPQQHSIRYRDPGPPVEQRHCIPTEAA